MFNIIKTFVLLAITVTALFVMFHLNSNIPDLKNILQVDKHNSTVRFWAIDAADKPREPEEYHEKQYEISFKSNPHFKDRNVYFKGFSIGRIMETALSGSGEIICRVGINPTFAKLLKEGCYAQARKGKLSIISSEEGDPISATTMPGYLSLNEYHRQQLEKAADKLAGNFTAIAEQAEGWFNKIKADFENATAKEAIR
ncbi:hypothetical protein [Maridesulfovibrio zosterae]|uniref:hypothetical protein n=1 Tax=Maridesulfovibrio zosterae TaxID=82171 RepID=UPI00040E4839|nr:hypothetical protein [Maridesulfovibrio zosterae]